MRYARLTLDDAELVIAGRDLPELVSFELHRGRDPVQPDWACDDAAFADARMQLREWFVGERRAFDLELAPVGTPFQRRVWAALAAIPYGQTRSYGDIAVELETAPRAVGSANGANNVAVLIPCHRVIRSDGSLGGYAYGVNIKRRLLEAEAAARKGELL